MPGEVDQVETDTNAQVEQAPEAQTPAVEQKADAGAGIQKRIDELVAEQHEWRRRFESERQQNQELLAALVSNQTQSRQQDPYAGVELDPDDKRKIESVLAPTMKQIMQRQRQMEHLLVQSQAREVAAQYGDPRVTELASKLVATWAQRGLDGWTPADAADMALAQVIKQERQKGAGKKAPVRSEEPDVLTQQSRATAPRGRTRPQNFDNLSPEKQLEIWEAEGIDDLPF